MPIDLRQWSRGIAERSSQRGIATLLPRMLRSVYRAMATNLELGAAQNALNDLDIKNPGWTPADTRARSSMTLLLLVLPAIYTVDYLLLAPVTEHLAAMAFRKGAVVSLAKAAIPLAFILIEVYIATQLALACEEPTGGQRWFELARWSTIGLVMALIMPSLILQTALAQQAVKTAMSAASGVTVVTSGWLGLDPVRAAQTVGMIALAVVAHVGVIFGGRHAASAKAYVAYRLNKSGLERRLRRLRATDGSRRTQATARFQAYLTTVNAHNARFAGQIAPGPFPAEIVQFVNQVLFRRDVIQQRRSDEQEPTRSGDAQPQVEQFDVPSPTEPAPSVTRPGNGEGAALEVDYLRRILERQVREREAEIEA